MSSTTVRSRSRTCRAVRVSSAPVGSSARTTSGRVISARGDRDPLLLAAGQLGRPVLEPFRDPDTSTISRSHRGSGLRPASRIGNVMFCSTFSDGSRL
jgi:hypothetical protein